jgi:ribosomal protein L11 methyltransferase
MAGGHIELRISKQDKVPGDLLIAYLGSYGFDGFWEERNELLAYIGKATFDEEIRKEVDMFCSQQGLACKWNEIAEQNWNAAWEENFSPVIIGNRCMVRAPFHQPVPEMDFDIIIEPRMSFGTGHHETTSLMVELILDIPLDGKRILDMGTGTGILAILARKKGAREIMAVDNDDWAYRNTLSNIELNQIKGFDVMLGDASTIKNQCFDIIFANINRNILLNDMVIYAGALARDGILLLSGFYSEDLEIIDEKASESGLIPERNTTLNNWVAAQYKRRTE